jgi:mono/diheme cytochrome c family protein
MTARMAEMRDMLGDSFGRDVSFITLTVDPENDTPERMKAFADAFDARAPAWRFLTGKPEDIWQINQYFGDKSFERGLSSHRNEIVIGNGAAGSWTRNSVVSDLEEVIRDIRSMDARWADRPRPANEERGLEHTREMANNTGEILFKKVCASCHTVGRGDRVGPDLRGVTQRRDRAWLAHFIAAPNELIAQKDPTALALYKAYREIKMPNLRLGDVDVNALIGYLDSDAKTAAAAAASAKHYTLHGRVLAINAKDHSATVAGEAVPGWMGAMTMKYPVPNEKDLQALRVGQTMTATVEVRDDGNYTLSGVKDGNATIGLTSELARTTTKR